MSSYTPFSQSSSYLELLNSQEESVMQENSPNEFFPAAGLNGEYELPPWSSQQPQEAPLSQEPPVTKDRKKWNPTDDEVLISAWLNTSKDSITGNEQRSASFWKRVGDYYRSTPHAKECGEDGVNINCKQRWHRIQEATNKFYGAYAAAERLQSSGQSENDVLKVAHDIYFTDQNTKYTMEHCWCLLRFEQKFLNLNNINNPASTNRRKRKPINEGSQSSINTEQEFENRPEGVKAAKGSRNNGQGKALAEYKSMWDIKKSDQANVIWTFILCNGLSM